MFDLAEMAFPLRLSLQVATSSTVLVAAVGIPLAYLLARARFRGREILDLAITLPMVLPPVVTGYYLLLLLGRNGLVGRLTAAAFGKPVGMVFTWQAAVLAAFVVSLPLAVKASRSAIEAVDPALAQQSWLLGRSRLETALRIELPLAWRGIVGGLSLAFARALGEFGATLMVAGNVPGETNTMPLELYNLVVFGEWREATTLVVGFTIISAALLFGVGRLGTVRSQ